MITTTTYQITYGHSTADCIPGTLTLVAANDADAIGETRKLVADGFRNESWAVIDLADGRAYTVQNVRGTAVGHYV